MIITLLKLNTKVTNLNKFVTVCIDTLNNQAPSKKGVLGAIIYHS